MNSQGDEHLPEPTRGVSDDPAVLDPSVTSCPGTEVTNTADEKSALLPEIIWPSQCGSVGSIESVSRLSSSSLDSTFSFDSGYGRSPRPQRRSSRPCEPPSFDIVDFFDIFASQPTGVFEDPFRGIGSGFQLYAETDLPHETSSINSRNSNKDIEEGSLHSSEVKLVVTEDNSDQQVMTCLESTPSNSATPPSSNILKSPLNYSETIRAFEGKRIERLHEKCLPMEAAPSEWSDDGVTGNDPSESLELTISTSITCERKRQIIEKVMETFDEISTRSPASWYSDSIGEENDTDYGSDSASLSWSPIATEVKTLPESAGYSEGRPDYDQSESSHDNNGMGNAGSARGSTSSAGSSSGGNEWNGGSGAKGKRQHDQSGSSGEDEGDGNDDRRKRQRTLNSGQPYRAPSSRKFACPYSKRYADRTPKAPSCVFPGYPNVSRLKGHLYRTHMRPLLCHRCYETFQEEADLAAHHNADERCNQSSTVPEVEGITQEQERQLKSKKRMKGDDSEERKWECVYRILFPGETEIPSPYCDFDPQVQYSQMSPGSANLIAFEQFSRENLRQIVQRRLEMQIEREEIIVEERLRSMMFDIMRMAQEDMFNQWRNSLYRVSQRQETNAASNEQQNGIGSTTPSEQDAAEGDISNLVVPPPPTTDHADAREPLVDVVVNKPGPADSGFFSFDTSSNRSEQPENAQTTIWGDCPCSPQPSEPLILDDLPSPTVVGDFRPAEERQDLFNSYSQPRSELGMVDLGPDPIAQYFAGSDFDDTVLGAGCIPTSNYDLCFPNGDGRFPWNANYEDSQQGYGTSFLP